MWVRLPPAAHGLIAQLGEHLPCTQEAAGSIPAGSTETKSRQKRCDGGSTGSSVVFVLDTRGAAPRSAQLFLKLAPDSRLDCLRETGEKTAKREGDLDAALKYLDVPFDAWS